MPDPITPQQAAARLEPADTLGIPLGTGQPPAFMAALGERDDWTDLRIYGALLLAWSEAFKHPNVHYLSGFFGPVERSLRDAGANISFAPADFRRFDAAARAAGAAGDGDGRRAARRRRAGAASRCTPAARSRSCIRAGADPDRLLWSRSRRKFPRTLGLPPEHRHALHVDQIDILVESEAEPFALPDARAERDRRARSPSTPRRFIPDGATLQTGHRRRSRRRSSAGSPTATAATTASTRRCSPTASCACTRPAR